VSERNPDLPILDEIGAQLATLLATEETEAGGRSTGSVPPSIAPGADRHAARKRSGAAPSRARRERGAQASRIGRRAAIVLVLVCLVGGVAFAALRGGGSGKPAHTAPERLGRATDGAWTLSVYRDGGRLCTVFVPRGGELSGRCGTAPGRGEVWAQSAIAGGDRYVFGIGGVGVAKVEASLEEAGVSRATWSTAAGRAQSPADAEAARAAGFPAGDSWFVFDLGSARPGREHAPATVVPLDRSGHRAGAPYMDCSLGVIGSECRRRIERSASSR
jgi:hypothetical protein